MSVGRKKILITGSTGLIASAFINRYKDKFQILAISRKYQKIDQVETLSYSLTDFEKLESKILEFEPNIVINTAFYLSSKEDYSEITQFSESLLFSNKLLRIVSGIKDIHWIETRSFSEFEYYKNEIPIESPKYLYSVYKKFTFELVEWYASFNKNFLLTELILFSVYGTKSKNKKVIDYLIDSLDSENLVKMSSGKQMLDFVHIDDVLDAIDHSIMFKAKKLWVGTGITTRIRDLSRIILELFDGKKLAIIWDENNDRSNDIYYAKAPVDLNKDWSAKIDLKTGINKYIKNFIKS